MVGKFNIPIFSVLVVCIQELWLNDLKNFENEASDAGQICVTEGDDAPMSATEIFTGRSFKHHKLLQSLEFLSTSNDKLKLDTQFEKLHISQVN
jgi:hypothetical protein